MKSGHEEHVRQAWSQFEKVTAGPAPPLSVRSCLRQICSMSAAQLRNVRQGRLEVFRQQAQLLRAESDELLARAPPHVQSVLRAAGPLGSHPALLRWSLQQIGWSDSQLVEDLLRGFPLVGDIPVGPESTEKRVRSASLGFDELSQAGLAQVDTLLAKARAKEWSDESAQVWEATVQDVDVGRMSRPVAAESVPGTFVTRRFAVVQTDSKGKSKVRCIDDFLESLVNDATTVRRRIRTGRLSDLEYAVKHLHRSGRDVVLLKSDFKSAYRGCPILSDHLRWSNILVNSPDGPRVSTSWAMPFGAVGAVYAWDRVGSAVAAILRSFFLVPVSRYVDDLFWAEQSETSQEARELVIEAIHLLGLTVEVSKTPSPSKCQDILGVTVTVQQPGRQDEDAVLAVRLEAGKSRVWLEQIDEAVSRQTLSMMAGQKLAGRLCFGSWAIWGPEATSHLKSLYAHVYQGGGLVSQELASDLKWWKSRLTASSVVRTLSWSPPKAVVYTDAEGSGRLAGVCICHIQEYWSVQCPSQVSALFVSRKTQICAFESVAAVAALIRWGSQLRHHTVLFFVDNQSALGSLRKGSSPSSDLNAVARAMWAVAQSFQVRLVLRYVPSKLNVADRPSRGLAPVVGAHVAMRIRWESLVELLRSQ